MRQRGERAFTRDAQRAQNPDGIDLGRTRVPDSPRRCPPLQSGHQSSSSCWSQQLGVSDPRRRGSSVELDEDDTHRDRSTERATSDLVD